MDKSYKTESTTDSRTICSNCRKNLGATIKKPKKVIVKKSLFSFATYCSVRCFKEDNQ